MPRRLLAVVLPVGLAACERPVVAPEAPPPREAVAVAGSARMHLSSERRAALNAAVADARLRLLPALTTESDGPSALGDALRRLEESLAAEDRAGLADAVARAESEMNALAPDEADAGVVEMDAIRLLLVELRLSASEGRAVVGEE